MNRLELRGIVKSFGGVRALKGVDAVIEAGRTLVLLGENGAGKSTLIRTLTGAVRPDEGEILIDGVPVVLRDPMHARALGITAVYQEPMIFPHLSVLENIFAGFEITDRFGRVQTEAMLRAVRPWLSSLDLAESLLRRPMADLGLGHQQLVLIAQALVQDARIIVFDEPTAILSRAETDRLVGIIHRLRDDGRAIVYITHRLEEVPRVGDHVTVLTDGRVTGDYAASDVTEDLLLRLMMGQHHDDGRPDDAAAAPPPDAAKAPPVLSIRGLSHPRHFQDVDWDVSAGRVTGIYGLVGAGRSEVAMTVFGALRAARGRIMLDGREISPRSPAEAMALGIGYLPEDRKKQGIFAPMGLESNLTCTALVRLSHGGWLLDFPALLDETRAIMRRFAIKADTPDTAIGTLSGGNQQKGLFARWAGQDLRVLILDEPTRGIDLATKAEIHGFIRQLAQAGMAVVVITSDLAELMAVSQDVIVMRQGLVVDRFQRDREQGAAPAAERVLAAAIGAATTGQEHAA
ncbi:ABC transporter related [Gluconacetobacter diazotrophicus PA1 5]|uniref:Ribose transport ATP-binding protein rbsA n=2 Tax=Gluconacetobacter diazotrophicus TaxID=33996 RepID=A9HG14_GLUDA|nr:sugar ABC transporter ATP-binding protein [Gluconacetobacter diazotrophicus]ACI51949.1 ABC transporter related [Gluconacetobacter diazotrophicus PA1 5]MBB2157120.1 sugar ABC transporter ATP-binding protein [Gluconacetobacter diazotrophicus]TWB05146.1 monosaccharide ABC transporter ATP-binding protein (CUT2 family) [Gluconacetobacter diazotrophicus]CAP55437.1 Ribose transport ATP-binding protein rbsA [Gluconacetobacter diazotrophicus PA1 5]